MEKNLWWMPSQLKSAEKEIREIDDLESLDTKNDFGSYRYALITSDLRASEVGSHNDLDPVRKVVAVQRVLRLSDLSKVLDVGCGLGFTTNSMAACFPDGEVVGVDVSEDAIKFAQKNFLKPRFLSMAIGPDSPLIGKFDCIFCFEFYPFSRTFDIEFQSALIEWFGKQLEAEGRIVIYQRADNPHSFHSRLPVLREKCAGFDITVLLIPHPKLPSWIPDSIAMLVSKAISLFGREGVKKIVVIKRKS